MINLNKNFIDKVFTRLTVVEKLNNKASNGATLWKCICECGKHKDVSTSSLNAGTVKSCGCLNDETRTKHNLSGHELYNVWVGMRRRCADSKYPSYENYGGRGISVCKRWNDDFANFLADIGERPNGVWDIDRRDNNLGYNKDNCRWVNKSINAQNKRNSKRWIVRGIEYNSQNEASEATGISSSQINRMCKGYTRSNGKSYPPVDGCSCYNYYDEAL